MASATRILLTVQLSMATLFPHYVEYDVFFVTTALWSSTNL